MLLKRCVTDDTDEVRDRAVLALGILDQEDQAARELLKPSTHLELGDLESALMDYVADTSNFGKPFEAKDVRRLTEGERKVQESKATSLSLAEEPERVVETSTPAAKPEGANLRAVHAELVEVVPDISEFGKLLRTTNDASSLTEEGIEYQVSAKVHVFSQHLVLEFAVENTYETTLQRVEAVPELEDLELSVAFSTQIEQLSPHSRDTIYIALERDGLVLGNLAMKLRFTEKEEPTDEGEEVEYEINDLELRPGNYIAPVHVGSFTHQWDELSAEEATTRQLPTAQNLPDAVDQLLERLGMAAVDGTDVLEPDAHSHTLKLFGRSVDGQPAAASIRLLRTARSGIAAKATFRTSNAELSEQLALAF